MLDPFSHFRTLGESGVRTYRATSGSLSFEYKSSPATVEFLADLQLSGGFVAKLLPQSRIQVSSEFSRESGERMGRLQTYRNMSSEESSFSRSVRWVERDAVSVIELLWVAEVQISRAQPNAVLTIPYFDGQNHKRAELRLDDNDPTVSFSRQAELILDKLKFHLNFSKNKIREIQIQAPVVGLVKLELDPQTP